MSSRTILTTLLVLLIGVSVTVPVSGQDNDDELVGVEISNRDEAAIRALMNHYEQAFNDRDVEWRMSLCLDTYQEYAFEDGRFLHVWDYNRVKRETGGYWASIDHLEYSMDEIDVQLDGPIASVRAYTTHLAENDRHASVVHFFLVKIDGAWRIASDSYNVIRRFEN